MKLPHLFVVVHNERIVDAWLDLGRPETVRIVPIEPLPRLTPLLGDGSPMLNLAVPVVAVRFHRLSDGSIRYEAADAASLKVAQEWAARHLNTPREVFGWLPFSGEEP